MLPGCGAGRLTCPTAAVAAAQNFGQPAVTAAVGPGACWPFATIVESAAPLRKTLTLNGTSRVLPLLFSWICGLPPCWKMCLQMTMSWKKTAVLLSLQTSFWICSFLQLQGPFLNGQTAQLTHQSKQFHHPSGILRVVGLHWSRGLLGETFWKSLHLRGTFWKFPPLVAWHSPELLGETFWKSLPWVAWHRLELLGVTFWKSLPLRESFWKSPPWTA